MTVAELLDLISTRERALSADQLEIVPYLGHLSDALYTVRPARVTAVLALRRPPPLTASAPRLLTFARYRAAYSVIETMAKALASVVLQLEVTPRIVPLNDRDIAGLTVESPLIRRIERRGDLIYRQ